MSGLVGINTKVRPDRRGGHKMDAPDTKDVQVKVFLDLNHEPPFYFETTDLRLDPPCHLYFKRGKKNGFKIRFILQDPTYSFGDDTDKALYSTPDPICPLDPGQWKEFRAIRIADGGQTLIVHNKNSKEQNFGYTLRITEDGVHYRDLDPIGSNQNMNDD